MAGGIEGDVGTSFVIAFDDVTASIIENAVGALEAASSAHSGEPQTESLPHQQNIRRAAALLSLELIQALMNRYGEEAIKKAFGDLATKYVERRSELGIKGVGQVPISLTSENAHRVVVDLRRICAELAPRSRLMPNASDGNNEMNAAPKPAFTESDEYLKSVFAEASKVDDVAAEVLSPRKVPVKGIGADHHAPSHYPLPGEVKSMFHRGNEPKISERKMRRRGTFLGQNMNRFPIEVGANHAAVQWQGGLRSSTPSSTGGQKSPTRRRPASAPRLRSGSGTVTSDQEQIARLRERIRTKRRGKTPQPPKADSSFKSMIDAFKSKNVKIGADRHTPAQYPVPGQSSSIYHAKLSANPNAQRSRRRSYVGQNMNRFPLSARAVRADAQWLSGLRSKSIPRSKKKKKKATRAQTPPPFRSASAGKSRPGERSSASDRRRRSQMYGNAWSKAFSSSNR